MSTNLGPSTLDRLISQADAARLRGVTRQAVHRLVARGKLTAVEVAGQRMLLRDEVERFVPQPAGRPKKQ